MKRAPLSGPRAILYGTLVVGTVAILIHAFGVGIPTALIVSRASDASISYSHD